MTDDVPRTVEETEQLLGELRYRLDKIGAVLDDTLAETKAVSIAIDRLRDQVREATR